MWKLKSQCLSIHDIEVIAPVGVFEFEKLQQNRFLVSVDLWGDFRRSMHSDDLHDTLDYQQIFDISHQVLRDGGNLLEAAAQKIMNKILQIDFSLIRVRVLIKKVNPPLTGLVSDTSFELISERVGEL